MKVTNKFEHSLETTGLEFTKGKKINKALTVRVYKDKKDSLVIGFESAYYTDEFLLLDATLTKIVNYLDWC